MKKSLYFSGDDYREKGFNKYIAILAKGTGKTYWYTHDAIKRYEEYGTGFAIAFNTLDEARAYSRVEIKNYLDPEKYKVVGSAPAIVYDITDNQKKQIGIIGSLNSPRYFKNLQIANILYIDELENENTYYTPQRESNFAQTLSNVTRTKPNTEIGAFMNTHTSHNLWFATLKINFKGEKEIERIKKHKLKIINVKEIPIMNTDLYKESLAVQFTENAINTRNKFFRNEYPAWEMDGIYELKDVISRNDVLLTHNVFFENSHFIILKTSDNVFIVDKVDIDIFIDNNPEEFNYITFAYQLIPTNGYLDKASQVLHRVDVNEYQEKLLDIREIIYRGYNNGKIFYTNYQIKKTIELFIFETTGR